MTKRLTKRTAKTSSTNSKAKATKAPADDATIKALAVVRKDNALVTDEKGREYIDIDYDLTPEGDITDDNTPVSLSVCKLLQGQSKEVGEGIEGAIPGMYWNVDTQEPFDDMELVPLYRYDERYRGADPSNISSEQVCTSRDGKGSYGQCTLEAAKKYNIPLVNISHPVTQVKMPMGNCQACPNAMFGRDEGGNATKPLCRHVTWLVSIPLALLHFDEAFLNLLINGDEDELDELIMALVAVPFGGKARGIFDKQMRKMIRKARSVYGIAWAFDTRSEQGKKGTFFMPVVKPIRTFTKSERVILRSLSNLVAKLRPVMSEQLQSSLDVSDYEEGDDNTPPPNDDDSVGTNVTVD